eukprot:CAMPEP_0119007324 /NCGR_PEP_ID=MMETSP1176-20130426/2934_1 /TAXON_ID=265551 /ORGANISM="Synedropsis recta cf, Strain CCMP1620" /LENGTH=91 /DNA_ID=CAMNT_0006959447 /DNA_START=68 /DNA_END=343 /DNA_ORIENTATION=-
MTIPEPTNDTQVPPEPDNHHQEQEEPTTKQPQHVPTPVVKNQKMSRSGAPPASRGRNRGVGTASSSCNLEKCVDGCFHCCIGCCLLPFGGG